MSSVLIVNEISTEREEMTRALEAEGFTVVQAASAAEAVREIWGGSFLVAIIPTLLTGTTSTSLQQQLVQMAPEIESIYMFSSPQYSFLSSSGVKELAMFGGDLNELVPQPVAARLEEALKR